MTLDPTHPCLAEYAAIEYRRSLAALQYADAVYAVEAVRLRARQSVDESVTWLPTLQLQLAQVGVTSEAGL